MSTFTLSIGRPTLADRLITRSLLNDLLLIVAGAGLTAAAAQWVIPMWPVPITGQTFAVLFVGATLGASRAALSMVLYLIVGIAGVPVFANGASGSILSSTSGGFILSFIVASALVGWLAQREWDRKVLGTLLAFIAGTAVIYAIGLPWLYAILAGFPTATLAEFFGTTNVLEATLRGGLYPFLIGDTVKAVAAAALLPLAWRGVKRR